MSARSGSVLTQALLGMMICLMMLPIATQTLLLCERMDKEGRSVKDQLAVDLLRAQLLKARFISVSDSTLVFEEGGKQWQLCCKKDRLILEPGVQIFLDQIQLCRLQSEEKGVTLHYRSAFKDAAFFLGKGL